MWDFIEPIILPMDLGLEGRLCVVTGATRGIGRATAGMLAQEGARRVLGRCAPQRLGDAGCST